MNGRKRPKMDAIFYKHFRCSIIKLVHFVKVQKYAYCMIL